MTYIKGGILSAKQLNELSNGGGSGSGSLPDVTESDNNCVLTVIEGEWTPYPPSVSESVSYEIGSLRKIGSLVYFHFSGLAQNVVNATIPLGFRPASSIAIFAYVEIGDTITIHKLMAQTIGKIVDTATTKLTGTDTVEINAVWISF